MGSRVVGEEGPFERAGVGHQIEARHLGSVEQVDNCVLRHIGAVVSHQ
jgi:hypothetical protein